MTWRVNNKTFQILAAAEKGRYGVLAAIVYNVEHITAFVQAAENRRSPLILQLFPSSLEQTPSLIYAAAAAATNASVPVSVHLDHAQDFDQIRHVADSLPFDSIMVDMSHYEKEENLAKTTTLREYCHARGIVVEAETGRIEGGEDGIMGTGDLEGILTNAEDVEQFLNAGVDFLAPSVRNLHGDYGPRGPRLDMDRLRQVHQALDGRARLVLHGTNDFPPELCRACVEVGVTKFNVNKLVLDPWHQRLRENVDKPLTRLIGEGIELLTREMEKWMDVLGSSGKA
ncbi:class II fructose-bisphosphate aldolase [Aspergillus homomorphus CBS 101889]|uniref:Fructose-bisphosphate aldolase n=1 Tax=Aspergillus homomorphus (strain CBS 101889) TaxID=1450537 RepID=A0A395HLS4_ASPHC|nr:fructose/tagatose bisphosphate aldolase [Aspergillus homomorphus CBS 101889]RAL08892.1 fructose/tagatose bisphosphate aldolase [Aspergillus homomorphus CBS 101889]